MAADILDHPSRAEGERRLFPLRIAETNSIHLLMGLLSGGAPYIGCRFCGWPALAEAVKPETEGE